MWLLAAIVFVGGGLGAIVREFFVLELQSYSTAFPVDIFLANIIASFLLGLVTGMHQAGKMSDNSTLLIGTGFTGGMSTFSTFIYGAYSEMLKPDHLWISVAYLVCSVVIGYSAAWLGLRVTQGAGRT